MEYICKKAVNVLLQIICLSFLFIYVKVRCLFIFWWCKFFVQNESDDDDVDNNNNNDSNNNNNNNINNNLQMLSQ